MIKLFRSTGAVLTLIRIKRVISGVQTVNENETNDVHIDRFCFV